MGLDSLVAAQPAGAANPAQGAKALDAARASATVEVPDEHDPWIGRVIGGKYRLARRLGRGGMAFVYEAEVLGRIKREVAVKVLTPESAISQSTIARFLKEADAIAQIQHPHVVQLIELVETPEGVLVLVMERLRGKSLQELLQEMHARGENFRWERLAPRMLEVCSALQAAHELGIVHRDIKPSNLFVCNLDGKTPYLKIVGFGIAKAPARRTAD